jgi:hypothetical protein
VRCSHVSAVRPERRPGYGRRPRGNGQTDTYLNVSRMRQHKSMKRFDVVRCKTVASQPPIEHKLPCNGARGETGKDLLH